MNQTCLDILTRLAISENGQINRTELYSAFPNGQRFIAALATGTRPNIFLNENNAYQLTQRGFIALGLSGANLTAARVTLEQLPNYVRQRTQTHANATVTNGNGNIVNMVEIEIDRNEYIKVTCKVHDSFKAWVREHGTLKNFSDEYGSDALRNWDGDDATTFYSVNLQNVDVSSGGTYQIITNSGINSLIIKLACANDDGTYSVKYRGLVAWELIERHSKTLGENMIAFYKNYVKACNLKIAVQYWV